MRLLFISNFYPPYAIGGYEQWCQEVATGLKAQGHDVWVLTSRYGVDQHAQDNSQQIWRTLHLQTDLEYYRPIDFFLKNSRWEAENQGELRRALDEIQPDLVMVWGMWNLSLNVPYWAEEWMPERVAYFVSSYWPNDVDPHTAYWQLPTRRPVAELLKKPLRALSLASLKRQGYPPSLRFDHAVCCSQYVRQTLVEAEKLPSKAGVLLGGTDPEPFFQFATSHGANGTEPDTPLRLLYFGRLIHDKGPHTALAALGILKQRGLAAKVALTILGSGHSNYEAHLHKMADSLAITDRIAFVKQVPREDIPKWLAQHDIYLFTSIWPEPMARSVMEAMATGLLVIGTEVGGQTEMLDNGQNALTFQSEDAEQLAEQIQLVLDDKELRKRLAQAGQKMVLERFTLERMVNDIEEFLTSILDKSPCPST